MSYIDLIGRWCSIIVLNVHAPSKEKSDDSKDRFYEELEQIFNRFPKYHMKIILGDFKAKVGRENTFKLTIGNESLHQDSADNGVGIVNLATSNNLVLKGTMFPHRDFHKYAWTSADGKIHNHIDHILIDRRWHSSVLDVRSFRRADCDTDQYLVVAKISEILAEGKEVAQKFVGERLNFGKLNELEVRKRSETEITKRFVALRNLSDKDDINMVCENIKENIKTQLNRV